MKFLKKIVKWRIISFYFGFILVSNLIDFLFSNAFGTLKPCALNGINEGTQTLGKADVRDFAYCINLVNNF